MGKFTAYDSTLGGFKKQTFSVSSKPVVISAAGLTESVPIYISVSVCANCGGADVVNEPLMICGEPLVLSPDNNMVAITVPGSYSIGDPESPPMLSGDVNISLQELEAGFSYELLAFQLKKNCDTSGPSCCPASHSLVSPTGMIDEVTKMPVFSYSRYDSATGQLIEEYLYYHNPTTGEKIMQTTGFTPTPQKADIDMEQTQVWDNDAVPVLEPLTQWTKIVDGVIQPPFFTKRGTNTPWVPNDINKVSAKPKVIEMGKEDYVTSVDTAGSAPAPSLNFPLSNTVENSVKDKFPAYAYFHVKLEEQTPVSGDPTWEAVAGIAYTTDGSDPLNGENQVSMGQGFALTTYEEIIGFRARPISAKGVQPTTTSVIQTATVHVTYSNVAPDKDEL